MKYKPHSYQEYATQWIIDKEKAGLFLDMGLGKSVITLTAIVELMHDYFDVVRVLVIAPLRVAQSTWDAEINKWDHLKHLKISKVLGTEKERTQALNTRADIYIINRENVSWLVERYKNNWPFDMVVIDELSSFKSHKAQRFKALRKVRPFMRRVVGLTGTPAPNGLIDLWSQIYLLDGGERLGKTITGYRERYFNPDKRNQHIIFSYKLKDGAEEEIYKKLSDICVSMKSEDYLKLPERINNVIPVKLSDKAKKKYKQLERDLLLPLLDTDIVANTAAVLTNKLLQMANGAVYDEDGLNLQAGGNIIIWFGLTWSLELYQQANARLYRQGQKENVIIHHLVAEGTVDEDVMKALDEKQVGQEALLNAVKARLKKVS